LRMGPLLDADMKIKQIDWSIKDEIEKYNSGHYSTNSSTSTGTIPSYFQGDFVKILPGGVFHDRPNVLASVIGDDKKWPVAKILQQIDEKYYLVDVGGQTAYISPAFIGEKLNKQQFDNIVNTKELVQTQSEYQAISKAAEDAYSKGDFVTCRTFIDKLIPKYNDPNLFAYRGYTFYLEKNFVNAITDFSKAIDLNQNDPRYYLSRGDAYYANRDLSNAILDYSKTIDLNPIDPRGYFARGNAYYMNKDFIKSLIDLSKGLKIYPYNTDAYFLKGLMKSELGDRRGAISDYDSIIVHHVDTITHSYNLATVYNNKAYCLVDLEDYKTALPLVTKALSLNDSLWYIWDTRGELYYKIGKYQESISDMTKAISLMEHDNSYYYRGLAKIMLKLNGGCEDFSRAGELGKKEAYEAIKQYCK
jgi:tetratricopeptide (TPR) repeat protein